MNVYENIRNTRKMVEKLSRVCPTFPKWIGDNFS